MSRVLLVAVALLSFGCASSGGIRTRFWRLPSVPVGSLVSPYEYETKYFEQKIDHFSFTAGAGATFQQRYLINTDHWKQGSPIFFYCGNEGDITWFCNNTGFMWDIAPEYNAMVVFAEHRYYGDSLPFGDDSYKDIDHLGYLTSEQALADYVILINSLRAQYGDVPVVAFGGSYGGMLAAWLRMKYPGAVVGSIAASAPIWMFINLTDCEGPYRIISSTMAMYSKNCAHNVWKSWIAIDEVAAKNSTEGLSLLSTTFSLCQPLKYPEQLTAWLMNVWFDMAMANYPYATNFLEPLPAWPLNVTCQHLADSIDNNHQLLQALASAVQVYYNYTGQSPCVDLDKDSTDDMGEKGWSFQACTEMAMPMCSDNQNDVFPKLPWTLESYLSDCQSQYKGIQPRPLWIEKQYNGKNLTGITNIVFSNGDLDPWSAGGVTTNLSDSLVAVIVKNGAHHLDMRAANELDTESVKQARDIHKENISKWLALFQSHAP